MTKAKKAISLVLAVIMMFSVMSVIAFANDAPVEQTAEITLSYDKAAYNVGDTVTVTVKLTSDYFVAATGVPLQFDAAAVDYVSTTKGALYGSTAATEMAVNHLTKDGKDFIYVALSPLNAQGAVAQICNSVVLYTATFTAKTAITDTSAVFGILDNQKTMSNLMGKLYVGAYETEDVKSQVYTTGQILTFPVMETAPVGTPELVLTSAGNGAVIDRVSACNDYDGFVYGVDTINGEDIASFVTTDFGSVTVNANDQGNYSTGATIELKDAAGTVIETYVFVYFGDVNGDASTDASDITIIEGIASYSDFDFFGGDGSVAAMAADSNGDESIDSSDITYIEGVAGYSDFPTQAETALIVSGTKLI